MENGQAEDRFVEKVFVSWVRCFLFVSMYFLLYKEIFEKCQIPFDIPYLLYNNNTNLNNILNEEESLDYECIDGYARMTNVTCKQGYLSSQPLCEPSKNFKNTLNIRQILYIT